MARTTGARYVAEALEGYTRMKHVMSYTAR